MNQTHITYMAMAIAALIGVWLLFVSLPRWYESNEQPDAEETSVDQRTALETTDVTLFYVSEDGMQLVGLERKIHKFSNFREFLNRWDTLPRL